MARGISSVCLNSEVLPQLLRRLLIHLFKIGHELLTTRHHLEQSPAGMEILRVFLEMCREFLDLLSKEDDLILRRTGVLLMPLERSGHLFLLLVRQGHSHYVSNDRVWSKAGLHRARIKISHEHNTMPPRFLQLLDFIGFSL